MAEENENKALSYDNLFNRVGEFGLYQILIVTAVSSFAVLASSNNFATALTVAKVPHTCNYPKNLSESVRNLPSKDKKLLIIPKNSKGEFESCLIFDR